jgi:hypothetical protein
MKRTLACAFALGLFGALAGVGCSGEDPNPEPTGGTNSGTIALDAYANELAKVYCNRIFTCCTAVEQAKALELLSPTPKNEAECTTAYSALFSFVIGEQKDSVAAGRQTYDGAKASNCFAKLEGSCAGGIDNDDIQNDPECATVFVGKVADGGMCTNDGDCSSAGSVCNDAGVCTALAAEGQPCTFSSDCQEGLTCGVDACIKPKAEGEACTSSFDCASTICEMGVCAPKKADGAMCTFSEECASGDCDATDTCAAKLACDGM